MTGRRLFWILLPVLGAALVWQARETWALWQASRILNAVETVTLQAGERGGLPRQISDHHLRLLRRVAAADPAMVDVPVAEGWQYLLTDRPQGAVRAFERALALEPRARVYANLGEAYLRAGRYEEAVDALEKAIVLDPRLAAELEPSLSRARRR